MCIYVYVYIYIYIYVYTYTYICTFEQLCARLRGIVTDRWNHNGAGPLQDLAVLCRTVVKSTNV